MTRSIAFLESSALFAVLYHSPFGRVVSPSDCKTFGNRSRANVVVAMIVAAMPAMIGGCVDAAAQQDKLVSQLEESGKQLRLATQENVRLRKTVAGQQQQIRTLGSLGPARLEKLFHVNQVSIGKYTGGVDEDRDKPGDEGVKVYIQPADKYGSAVKAAGDVKIQLYDLAAPPDENLLGEYTWGVDQMPDRWAGGFMGYQFRFFCPWKSGPPKHDAITVRVEFTDYLTGKRFITQRVCGVTLPPATQPAK